VNARPTTDAYGKAPARFHAGSAMLFLNGRPIRRTCRGGETVVTAIGMA
jgi:hypothetical protein